MKKFTKEITALLTTVALGVSASTAASAEKIVKYTAVAGTTMSENEEICNTPTEGVQTVQTTTMPVTTYKITPTVGTYVSTRPTTMPTTTTTTSTIPPTIGTQTGTTTRVTTTPPFIGTQTAATTTEELGTTWFIGTQMPTTTTVTEIPPFIGTQTGTTPPTTIPSVVVDDVPGNGDVNDDGSLNIADVVTLSNYLMNKPDCKIKNPDSADVCKDGEINVFDLAAMRTRILSGQVSKPVSKRDIFVSVADLGIMDGCEVKWTGTNPWTSITIEDSFGTTYEYRQEDGKEFFADTTTGEAYSFEVATTAKVINGFIVHGLPKAEYYGVTITGSADIYGSDDPCTWNEFVTHVSPQ